MDGKALKTSTLQNKNLTPYILVAVASALIALGSFLGGVAYQKSLGGGQPGNQMNQNGTFPNNGSRPSLRGGNQGNSLQNGQSETDQQSDSDGGSL